MAQVQSFEPIIGHQPRVLILGSMPGIASLDAVQYYAHPRNAFWSIMSDLFAIDHRVSYENRVQQISKHPVILWDTLKYCYRPGSLDSSIERDSVEANDIAGMLEDYRGLRAIAFNGAASEKYFRNLVKPQLAQESTVELLAMPSTSPAHAGMSFEQKLLLWRRLLAYID